MLTWSAVLIAPTAIVAMLASLRIAPRRRLEHPPYTGFDCGSVWPVDVDQIAAICLEHAGDSTDPRRRCRRIQSVADRRTDIGFISGHTTRQASNTSSGAHPVLEPPAVLIDPPVGDGRDEARKQVAVRHAARACRTRTRSHLRRGDVVIADRFMSFRAACGACESPDSRAATTARRSASSRSGAGVHLLPAELGRALAAGVAELDATAVGLHVHELHDPLPRGAMLGLVHAGAAGGDARVATHALISVNMRPARPTARDRSARSASRSASVDAEYWHIGETTTRFATVMRGA